jgi:hypothetical protein
MRVPVTVLAEISVEHVPFPIHWALKLSYASRSLAAVDIPFLLTILLSESWPMLTEARIGECFWICGG